MEYKLDKLKNFNERPGPLVFIIMDGVGIGKDDESNAVFLAHTPNLDKILDSPLKVKLKAHGPAVGLPSEGDMGNSEVGHNAIGAGRVFDQGAKLVNKSIDEGSIYETEIWSEIARRGLDGKTVHFIGLLSNGNVHSHIDHLFALVNKCADTGIESVCVHPLLDGRDVDRRSALYFIKPTETLLQEISGKNNFNYRIGSGGGRMVVTMDRYMADWDVVKKGWDAHVHGIGRPFYSASDAVRTFYDEDPDSEDQYLDSFVVTDQSGAPAGKIEDGDAVVFFNFRGDRAIEITMAFENEDFDYFNRGNIPRNIYYAGMLEYDGDLKIPKNYLVPPPHIDSTVSEFLCADGVTSFAISETQKYGHVTYFWNGNRSGYIDENLETYVEIPSDKIEFDKAPKMKAYEITDKAIELINSGKYRFGRINFANGDMVGHTGVPEASVTAVETVDECIGRIVKAVTALKGIVVISADHGNCDELFVIKKEKKNIKTSHSLNPVYFVISDTEYHNDYIMADIKDPGLANIAGTLLNLLGYKNISVFNDSLIKFY